jgi:hypothetical protein
MQAEGGALMARRLRIGLRLAALTGMMLAAGVQSSQTEGSLDNPQLGNPTNVCGTRDVLVEKLSNEFQENQAAVGMLHDTAILEVFVSEQGSWTILATGTDGQSCVLAAGKNWETAITAIGQGA